MKQQKQIIEWIKEVKFTPFPNGGGLDVSVKHQLPEHAFEAIANHLLTNGVFISPFVVGDSIYLITNSGEIIHLTAISVDIRMRENKTSYEIWATGEIDGLSCLIPIPPSQIGEVYFKTHEAAEKALKGRND